MKAKTYTSRQVCEMLGISMNRLKMRTSRKSKVTGKYYLQPPECRDAHNNFIWYRKDVIRAAKAFGKKVQF